MKTLEFTTELEKALENSSAVEIETWLKNYRDLQSEMVSRILFLARHFDSLSEDSKTKYVNILLPVLESIPNETKIRTSSSLLEKLKSLIQSVEVDSDKAKLLLALEKHTITT